MSTPRDTKSQTAFVAGEVGTAAAYTRAEAADALRAGLDSFLEAANRLFRVPADKRLGNLFEYIEAAKFNSSARLHGVDVEARVTAQHGAPTGPVDIHILREGEVVADVQAKASRSTYTELRQLSDPKYSGMEKLVPSDHADVVRTRAEALADRHVDRADVSGRDYGDTARRVRGELQHGDASSGGTTYAELEEATRNPRQYALLRKLESAGHEVFVAAAAAAATGAVLGAGLSAARRLQHPLPNGGYRALLTEIARDAATSGLRSGAVATLGVVLRHSSAELGITVLTQGNVATALAAGMIEIGGAVWSLANGTLTTDQAATQIAVSGCRTVSGIYGGALAGAAFGPAGAVIGSITGYLISTHACQSSLAILSTARMEARTRRDVESICEASIRAKEEWAARFVRQVGDRIDRRGVQFEACFAEVDAALTSDHPEAAIHGISMVAILCGKALRFSAFADFDVFMLSGDAPLIL